MPKYEVLVGNIGSVYLGGNQIEARKIYREYVSQSKTNYGRAGGEDVTLWEHGEIIREHVGSLSRAEMKREN